MPTIFITGAASGIGCAAARRFHERGWTVGLVDADEAGLKRVSAELNDAWFAAVDVRDADAVQAVVDAFCDAHGGRLDLLFNSAGVLRTGRFEEMSPHAHSLLVDVNVKGVMHVLLAAFGALQRTPGALVVNMSSASALYGTPDFASYSASKFAVRGLTEALDIEWRKHDIQVVDLMPPFVRGPMVDANPSRVMDRLGVDLTPEEIAEALFRLARARRRPVHTPVGRSFRALSIAAKVLPTSAVRGVMRYLDRP